MRPKIATPIGMCQAAAAAVSRPTKPRPTWAKASAISATATANTSAVAPPHDGQHDPDRR